MKDTPVTDFDGTERFVCLLYGAKSMKISDVRSEMFGLAKNLECMPPTQEAFRQHVQRAWWQTQTWRLSIHVQETTVNPSKSGWTVDNGLLVPYHGELKTMPDKYKQLTSCRCVNCASAKCSCNKLNERLLPTCKCSSNGQCWNVSSHCEINA